MTETIFINDLIFNQYRRNTKMKRTIIILLLASMFSGIKLFAQTEEDVRDFIKYLEDYQKAFNDYHKARSSEDATEKSKAPQLLTKLLEYFNNPVIEREDIWGDLSSKETNMEIRFKENNYYTPPMVYEKLTYGQVIREDLGESGSIGYVLKYDNETEYDLEKDYFYYDVVKSGPVSWEQSFKVKRFDGKFKMYDIFYKEF